MHFVSTSYVISFLGCYWKKICFCYGSKWQKPLWRCVLLHSSPHSSVWFFLLVFTGKKLSTCKWWHQRRHPDWLRKLQLIEKITRTCLTTWNSGSSPLRSISTCKCQRVPCFFSLLLLNTYGLWRIWLTGITWNISKNWQMLKLQR